MTLRIPAPEPSAPPDSGDSVTETRTAMRKAMREALDVHRGPVAVHPQEVHRWLNDFSWDLEKSRGKYATKYNMASNTKEQFKITAKEYARMEVVKEERQYGTLLDGLERLGAGKLVHPGWGDAMKVFSNYLECGEYNAIAGAALLWDTAPSPEQKNGYLAQVMDEVRHTNQCGYLNHYFSKHYDDPAGHNCAHRLRSIGPLFRGAKRAFGDAFLSGDPVECSLNLQLVGEACFTNPLIVSITEWAAANGDEITPTIFLSIETDELRHMANGFHTIVSIVNDPATAKHLQPDLDNAFWTQQKFFTPLIGFLLEYFSRFKVEPWVKTWNRWVYEDWAGIWLGRLRKYGIQTPSGLPDAKRDAVWSHHDLALVALATWPLHHWRSQLPDARDMEWFELHYPGWYERYGVIYDEWRRLGYDDPNAGFNPLVWLRERRHTIYIDRVSHLPFCPTLAKGATELTILEYGGKRHAFADTWSERQFLTEPERYESATLWEQFAGWTLADVVAAAGGLRSDGRTLVAQPHRRAERMWTIDDLRALSFVILDPLA
jgi:methane monooxygenase component A alpha chain